MEVAQRRNGFASFHQCAAVGAVAVSGISFLRAVGLLGVPQLGVEVAQRRNGFASFHQRAAVGAVAVSGIPFLRAVGVLGVPQLGVGMRAKIRKGLRMFIYRRVQPLILHGNLTGAGGNRNKGQIRNGAACRNRFPIRIGNDNRSRYRRVGSGMGRLDIYVPQRQLGGIIGNRQRAAVGRNLHAIGILRGDIHGHGLLRRGLGTSRGFPGCKLLRRNRACLHWLRPLDLGGCCCLALLLVVGGGQIQRCRSDIVADAADFHGIVVFFAFPVGAKLQHIQHAALSGVDGDEHHAVVRHHHGAVIIHIVMQAVRRKRGGNHGMAHTQAVVDIRNPHIARVIQQQELLVSAILILASDAVGGNGHEMGGPGTGLLKVFSEHPGTGGEILRAGRDKQEIAFHVRQIILAVLLAEHLGLGHVPKVVAAPPWLGKLLARFGVKQMHIAVKQIGVHGINAVAGQGRGADAVDLHLGNLRPGGFRFHIPGIGHGLAVGILQHALQGIGNGLNRYLAGCRPGLVQNRRCSDHARAGGNTGHHAVSVHGCDAFITGGPDHPIVTHVDRADGGNQLLAVALGHAQRRLRQGNALHSVGGIQADQHTVGGGIACIVHRAELVHTGLIAGRVEGNRTGLPCPAYLGLELGQQRRTRRVIQRHTGQILIVPCGDSNLRFLPVGGSRNHLWLRVIHHKGNRERGALAQRIPVHLASFVHVVLRRHGQCQRIGLAVFPGRRPVKEGIIAAVVPRRAIDIVVCRVNRIQKLLVHDLARLRIGHGDPAAGRVADQAIIKLPKAVAGDGVDCVALGVIAVLREIGVAAKVIRLGIIGMLNGHVVQGSRTQVGQTVLYPGLVLLIGANVKHGRLCPTAIVAQHGNGVGNAHHALLGGLRLSEHIAFDVCAGGIMGVQLRLLRSAQGQCHIHLDLTVRAQNDAGCRFPQEQIGIVAGDCAVAVKVRIFRMGNLGNHACAVLQQSRTVRAVHLAVAVEIQRAILGQLHGLSVHRPLGIGLQHGGLGVQEETGVAVVVHGSFKQILREQLGAQAVELQSIGQIMNGEREGIFAGAEGIIAQLRLDLAVGVRFRGVLPHQDVAVGRDGVAHIGQTSALLQHRVPIAAVRLHNRLCRGGQQRLRQSPNRQPGLFRQAVFLDILGHQRRHTGHLRRGHGGAGHGLIGGAAGNGAVDGIDVATGRRDLRLQLQRAGNAPGAEIAHGVALCGGRAGCGLVDGGQLAGVVQRGAVVAANRLRGCHDDIAISLDDGNAGNRRRAAGQIHVDAARLIVHYHAGRRAMRSGRVQLLVEGAAAPIDEDNLSCNLIGIQGQQVVATRIHRHIVKENVVIQCAGAICRSIQSGNRRIGVRGIKVLRIINLLVANAQIGACVADVVHRGNREGIGIGAGRANGIQIHAVIIQVAAIIRIGHPAVGVAGGDAHHRIRLGQLIQDVLINLLRSAAGTGIGRAKRQVHRVTTQDNGILNGNHIVGIPSAAVLAEDLHGKNLRIRRHALGLHRIQRVDIRAFLLAGDVGIGRRNACHVRTMLALAIVVVDDIKILVHIVKTKGNLARYVQLTG